MFSLFAELARLYFSQLGYNRESENFLLSDGQVPFTSQLFVCLRGSVAICFVICFPEFRQFSTGSSFSFSLWKWLTPAQKIMRRYGWIKVSASLTSGRIRPVYAKMLDPRVEASMRAERTVPMTWTKLARMVTARKLFSWKKIYVSLKWFFST